MKCLKGLVCLAALIAVAVWAANSGAQEIIVGYTGPLSGPAAEYGQDCLNGIDMAVKDINAAGGITVKGKKYLFRLDKLDDRADPTQAVNNARRFRTNKAIAVFSGVFNTIAPVSKINEEKGNEFIVMGYTSTPKVVQMGNKLLIGTTAPFTVYCQSFCDKAYEMGWRKAAILTTLGAYGDEWRHTFRTYWQKIGGKITVDKPANYYTETDFSAPLTAALATKPDFLLIGGPSSTTALVIEQARGMGFKGGFMLIDQAKLDYIAEILKGYKLMENTMGVAAIASLTFPSFPAFDKKYVATYKRMNTSEAQRNYLAMLALSKAIVAAGVVDDVYKIRAAFPKAFPILGDRIPIEAFGINDNGRLQMCASAQIVKDGKPGPPIQYFWWPKNQKEWDAVKKMTKSKVAAVQWFKAKIDNVD